MGPEGNPLESDISSHEIDLEGTDEAAWSKLMEEGAGTEGYDVVKMALEMSAEDKAALDHELNALGLAATAFRMMEDPDKVRMRLEEYVEASPEDKKEKAKLLAEALDE